MKILFTLIIAFITINAMAQTSISTESKELYIQDGDDYALDYDIPFYSIVEFSNDYSAFKHITESMTSFYKVDFNNVDSILNNESGKKYKQYIYIVTSDVGNRYIVRIDFFNDIVSFEPYHNKDIKTEYTIIYNIKSVFDNSK